MVQGPVLTALIEHVRHRAERGDASAVVAAIDEFVNASDSEFMHIGPEKGAAIEAVVQKAQPSRILELGTFFGYSGICLARALPANGEIVTVEISKRDAKLAQALFEYAGVAERITLHVADARDVIATLDGSFDLVVFDHYAGNYYRDLVAIEGRGLIESGGHLVADNVLIHEQSCRDYLARVRDSDIYESETFRILCRHHGNTDDAIEVSRRR